jgi:hypothetical protein
MPDYTATIENLEAALGSGERTVRVEGKEVEYRSIDEIQRALAYFRGKQAQQTSARPLYASTLATFGDD